VSREAALKPDFVTAGQLELGAPGGADASVEKMMRQRVNMQRCGKPIH